MRHTFSALPAISTSRPGFPRGGGLEELFYSFFPFSISEVEISRGILGIPADFGNFEGYRSFGKASQMVNICKIDSLINKPCKRFHEFSESHGFLEFHEFPRESFAAAQQVGSVPWFYQNFVRVLRVPIGLPEFQEFTEFEGPAAYKKHPEISPEIEIRRRSGRDFIPII